MALPIMITSMVKPICAETIYMYFEWLNILICNCKHVARKKCTVNMMNNYRCMCFQRLSTDLWQFEVLKLNGQVLIFMWVDMIKYGKLIVIRHALFLFLASSVYWALRYWVTYPLFQLFGQRSGAITVLSRNSDWEQFTDYRNTTY